MPLQFLPHAPQQKFSAILLTVKFQTALNPGDIFVQPFSILSRILRFIENTIGDSPSLNAN